MVILPFGQSALLVELPGLDEVLALHQRLASAATPGIVDLVPAARTLLVSFDPRALSAAQVGALVQQAPDAAASPGSAPPPIELDIVYDGPDLAETATVLGVSLEALVAAHRAAEWTVAFTGFAPGFGYLVSEEWPYDVPRLPSPRTRVPVGAVGLAGEFSGAYPRETPGGWRLIGTTSATLFDPDAEHSVLLAPGTRVRFVGSRSLSLSKGPTASRISDPGPFDKLRDRGSLGDRGKLGGRGKLRGREDTEDSRPMSLSKGPDAAGIRIEEPGLLATVQDLGRPGRASLGVAPSGAMDRTALRTANRLLGNPEGAATVEVTMGGFRAVAERDCWFAVTGGWGDIRLGETTVDPYAAHPWRRGTELHLDWFARGARAYLALRGGVLAPEVLGSRSTDLLAGLGPAPLAAGDHVAIGPEPVTGIPALESALWGAPAEGMLDLELGPGPRADWFSPAALDALFTTEWTVSHRADRVGIRLDGAELTRIREGELPSEGMVPGAVQVPPDGRPVILGPDGPVTGGYPVIATLTARGLDVLAQARPGTRLRFRHARMSAGTVF